MDIALPEFRIRDSPPSLALDSNSLSIKKIDIYGDKSQISSLRNHDRNRIKLISPKINTSDSYGNHVNDDVEPGTIKDRSESFCSSQKTLVSSGSEFLESDNPIMESPDEMSDDVQITNNAHINDDEQKADHLHKNLQRNNVHPLRKPTYELNALIILVSIGSYILGYLGFAFLWIIFVLYQCVSWYINTLENDTESIIWMTKREMSMEKLKRDEGETVEWLNYLLLQIWRTFDPSLLVGLRDMLEDALSRSAPSFVRATDIEAFELGLIAPRIENIKIYPLSESEDSEDVLIGELRLSFRARSSKTLQDPPPPHVLAWIKTGISALIPIRVELLALTASIHFEIKLTGTSPFVSTAKISFLKIPECKTSIMPLIPVNIAQFPLIKQFIDNAMHSVLEDLTYPKFRDINLAELLSTDPVNDTQTTGIMKIDIFRAKNLTKVDVHGENDPYVLSSLDPPPYMHTPNTTRIIYNCANPEWKETFFHKIPQLDIVDERIKFKLSVMDWDRFTSDDLIGNAWVDIKNKIGDGTKRVKIHDGWHNLYLKPMDLLSRGQLQFRLEYFPKLPKNVEPSHDQTSGILGLQIHQGMSLQVTAAPYVKEASGIVLSDNVYDATYPNPYCVVYVNDAKEQFVKDWKTAVVRVVVKDQKDLEYDPVIGMATILLKELLEHKGKQGEKWYPLRHGVGCGKIRLSFVFRSVEINLSPEEKGYDVGTLLVHSIIAEDLNPNIACNHFSLTLSLCGSLENDQYTITSQGNPPSWLITSNRADQNKLQFGVLKRHRTGLVITLKQRGIFGAHTVGTTTFWLKDMCDCKEFEVKLPIYAKKSETSLSLRRQDQTVKEQQFMSNQTNNEEVSRPQHETFEDNQSNAAEGPSKEIISNESQQPHETNSDELEIGKIIYDEPQELGTSNELNNITPNELSQQGHCSSSTNDTNKQCKGYLKVKLYFRPGLSTAHEEDIKKSLTGVNASVLELNPFQNIQIRIDDETETFDIEERSVPDNIEMYESEIG
ncbi:22469_t:CDS:10, partial [Racocetra persica]